MNHMCHGRGYIASIGVGCESINRDLFDHSTYGFMRKILRSRNFVTCPLSSLVIPPPVLHPLQHVTTRYIHPSPIHFVPRGHWPRRSRSQLRWARGSLCQRRWHSGGAVGLGWVQGVMRWSSHGVIAIGCHWHLHWPDIARPLCNVPIPEELVARWMWELQRPEQLDALLLHCCVWNHESLCILSS